MADSVRHGFPEANPVRTDDSQPRDPLFIFKSSSVLEAMANPRRLHILTLLKDGEISVGELAQRVSLTQSALSQHLAKLRSSELVTTRRDAQTVYYTCKSAAVLQLLAMLEAFFPDQAKMARS